MDKEELEKWRKAGEIAAEALDFAIKEVRPKMKLIDIEKAIENKILEKAKLAFPVNLSLNNIAAHYSPKPGDETVFGEEDLLKIDIGANVDSYLSDTAITLYFGNDEMKKNLVRASFEALENAIKAVKPLINSEQIGEVIENTIRRYGFNPIRNLGGHRIYKGKLHGSFIPNYKVSGAEIPAEGAFALEPFTTNGVGMVAETDYVSIYSLAKEGAIRDPFGRETYEFIRSNFGFLPFSITQIVDKLGEKGILGLKALDRNKMLEKYPALREVSNGLVSQFEHTILVHDGEIEITTLRENERFLY